MAHVCRKCGDVLTDDNWNPSHKRQPNYICKYCSRKQSKLWIQANPEKVRVSHERANRKLGIRSFKKNRECTMFLGVHVAERVLAHIFKNVHRMPYGNPGFDFRCGEGYLIDVKCSCLRKTGDYWMFNINRNPVADYFLCLAFDNREYLNPMHIWLIPGNEINTLVGLSLSISTLHKWDKYSLNVSKVARCCDTLKGGVNHV